MELIMLKVRMLTSFTFIGLHVPALCTLKLHLQKEESTVLLNAWIKCLCIEQALNWDLYPETVVSWMKLYVQMASMYDFTNLLVPQFSQEMYIQITQVYEYKNITHFLM